MSLTCFKAYDVRGKVPTELNTELVSNIARAYAQLIKPKQVIIGHDIRLTGAEFCQALTEGFTDSGVDVYQLGLVGTEEIYFAVAHQQFDGGIMVTASHNPKDYNGLKLVKEQSRPISSDTGLLAIKQIIEDNQFTRAAVKGSVQQLDTRQAYIKHLLSYVDVKQLAPYKIVVNCGNGSAGPVIDALEKLLPFQFIKLNHQCDGSFPNGVPNPLLPEKRQETIDAIKQHQADLGIAFDGDFDRCFFFDESGEFIEGYYIVGLLAKALLSKNAGASVIHDPRLVWNTREIVNQLKGQCVQSKAGHAFIKERMREVNAVYGGEMSAHHYFRDFSYCDSGMIPWLMVTELMALSKQPLSALVNEAINAYPVSGEINLTVNDSNAVIAAIKQQYSDAIEFDTTDGLSATFTDWRFNVRASNTEPLLRINVEAKQDKTLLETKTKALISFINEFSVNDSA